MSATPPDVEEPRFRDALRTLPGRVWVISAGILVNRLGNFLPIFIVLYLTKLGYSAGAAGFVLGVAGIANVVGNAVGGYLADRIGRRWTIVVSTVPTAGLTATVPFVEPFPLIVTVVGLIGVTSQIYRPAAAAVLLDSVTTNQERLAAFGVFRFAMNIGAALGGVIGGALATNSYRELFLGNAAACLLFGVVVAVLLRDRPRSAATEPAAEAQADEAVGYRQAFKDRTLVRFLVMTLVAEFVYIQHTVGLPLHVNGLGLDEEDFGLLIGLNGLLVLALELPLTGVISRYRLDYVLALGNLLIGAGLALTGLMNGMIMLAVTVLIWTFGEMMSTSVANAYLGSVTPPRMVGRYQGLYFVAYTTGTGIGPLIGGALYAISPTALWIMVGAAGLLAARLCLPRHRDRHPGGTESRRGDSNP